MNKLLLFVILIQSWGITAQTLHTLDKDLPCINKHYNIYAHAVYDTAYTTVTQEHIMEALQKTNEMFLPICLSFSLCDMDTIFNYNYNALTPEPELGEVVTLYNRDNRINMYFLRDTLKEFWIGGLCAGTASNINDATIYIKSLESITHELGHFFGLGHTFDGFEELVNGSNCKTSADGICDTPADPYTIGQKIEDFVDSKCRFIYEAKDPNGQYYQPDVGNIMSYYGCDCGFTRGQYLRMVETYLSGTKKHW